MKLYANKSALRNWSEKLHCKPCGEGTRTMRGGNSCVNLCEIEIKFVCLPLSTICMKRKMQVAVCVWYKLYLHTTRCRVNSYHCYWRERPQAAHPTTRSDPASFRRALIALPFCPRRIWQLATAVRTNDRHEETCNGCVCGFGRRTTASTAKGYMPWPRRGVRNGEC